MREFIVNYPLFSYIAVPLLTVLLIIFTGIAIKPRSVVKNYFAKLYGTLLESIDFIDESQKSFSFGNDKLKILLKMFAKMKFYYEMLESEELYEVEGIINNIEKATLITKSLLIIKLSREEINDYLIDIAIQLKEIKKILYGFSISRDGQECFSIKTIEGFHTQKNKKRAAEYLKNIKNERE